MAELLTDEDFSPLKKKAEEIQRQIDGKGLQEYKAEMETVLTDEDNKCGTSHRNEEERRECKTCNGKE